MGDLYGRISATIVGNVDGMLQFDETIIYSTCDNIRIECVKQICHNDLMYIVVAKGTFLVLAVFGADFDLLDQKVVRCGNVAITGEYFVECSIVRCLQLGYFRCGML